MFPEKCRDQETSGCCCEKTVFDMKIDKVKVCYGRTVNLGNYESMRVDVEFSATIEQGETPENVVEK